MVSPTLLTPRFPHDFKVITERPIFNGRRTHNPWSIVRHEPIFSSLLLFSVHPFIEDFPHVLLLLLLYLLAKRNSVEDSGFFFLLLTDSDVAP